MGFGKMKEFLKKNKILHPKIPKPTIFKILPIAILFSIFTILPGAYILQMILNYITKH